MTRKFWPMVLLVYAYSNIKHIIISKLRGLIRAINFLVDNTKPYAGN
jgi:hypothetical protein